MLLTPNALTFLRMALAFVALPFFLSPVESNWILAAGIYTVGAVTDLIDGLWARRRSLVSNLGKILDPVADKCLVLAAYAAFVAKGVFSAWWLAPTAVREVAVTVERTRRLVARQAVPASSWMGKSKTVIQHLSVLACFLHLLARDAERSGAVLRSVAPLGTWSDAQTFSLALATAVTVVSGVEFFMGLAAQRSSKTSRG